MKIFEDCSWDRAQDGEDQWSQRSFVKGKPCCWFIILADVDNEQSADHKQWYN